VKQIRIALFSTRAEAIPIQQRLSQAGIVADVHEELGLARFWFISKATASLCLAVPAGQVELAEHLLLDWEAMTGALQGVIHCPECGSLRVDYPQFTGKFFLPNIAMGLAAAFGLLEKEYYCEHCHCMWRRQSGVLSSGRR
jgi:hypothetical protein